MEDEAEAFIFGSGTGEVLASGEGSVQEAEGKPEEGIWLGDWDGERTDLSMCIGITATSPPWRISKYVPRALAGPTAIWPERLGLLVKGR